MSNAVLLEFRKMHRLRLAPIAIVMVVAVAALSSAGLFASSTRALFADPSADPWAGLLLSYTMMAAMTSPLLTAVLASRLTEIEHTGNGWILTHAAGLSPGALCRAKLAALGAVLVLVVAAQTALVFGAGLLAGIDTKIIAAPWAGYALCLFLVDMAFLALHIWLAARVENQLITMGVGLLGSFIGVFALLMPPWLAQLLPWGYFAVISYTAIENQAPIYQSPSYGWLAGFLALVAVLFTLVTRHFDRTER